jgi:hypothetical protein
MTAIVVWLLIGGRSYNASYFPPYVQYADQESCLRAREVSLAVNGGFISFTCVQVRIIK